MAELPTGTVTFLFTDIEGSTKLWEKYPDGMKTALARHDEILRAAILAHSGYVVKTTGDGFHAAFPTALDALVATLSIQRSIHTEPWSETGPLKVRAALHTGEAQVRDGDYYGTSVNRAARLLSAGHGGQTLLSQATYELVRDALPEGVGLDNLGEYRMKDLARSEYIFQMVVPDLPTDFAPLKTLDTRPNNLPAQLTPIVGREKETEAVVKILLDDVRLITLTGPGGTGKTRLSLQVGAGMNDNFKEGVYFVPLASITDADLVPSTIAHTLGIPESGDQPVLESLKNYLGDKDILLILDNFEQVVSASPLLSDLLSSCPKLKVLVTSREVLHLHGEREYQVSPLSLPDLKNLPPAGAGLVSALSQYEAVELFIERALSVKADFAVTNDNAPAVAEICYRLDGLPLAIELAAARIKLLTPQAILKRLSSRMKLLTLGSRDLPARQQTIRGAIDWSNDLLEESEKILFRRLSIFVGGSTLDGAEEVCNGADDLELDILDGMASLVDKSLIKQEEVEGESRFLMLETIREYGLEQLRQSGEETAIRQNHADFFLTLAEGAESKLQGPDQVEWLNRLEVEYDNLKAVLELSSEETGEKAEVGLRLAGALWRFWLVRGYLSEGSRWLEGVLSASKSPSDTTPAKALWRAKALNGAGSLAQRQGDFARANTLLEESLATFREVGDKGGIAIALRNLGLVALWQDDNDQAATLFGESLALFLELGDKGGIAISLRLLGQSEARGDYDRARQLFEESLALCRELGDKAGIANSLRFLGSVIILKGDYKRATALLEESLALCRELGDRDGIAFTLLLLGAVAQFQDDYRRAREIFDESLVMFRDLGDKMGLSMSLRLMAMTVGAQEQHRSATRLNGAAEALGNFSLPPFARSEHEKCISEASTELGEKVFAAVWAEGRAMSVEEAIDYALNKVDDA